MKHPLLEIRGWHKYKKKWYYLNEDSSFRIKLGAGFNILFDRQPEPKRMYKLSFFGGIFDVGLRKVFTFDILREPSGRLWAVFLSPGRFQAIDEHGHVEDLHSLHPKRNKMEVIGDKYSTPDLWKKLFNPHDNSAQL